jgi:hypothetical protein
MEIVQKRGAAQGPSADAQTAVHFHLVAHADLSQLYAHAENRRQILDKLPKIQPGRGVK